MPKRESPPKDKALSAEAAAAKEEVEIGEYALGYANSKAFRRSEEYLKHILYPQSRYILLLRKMVQMIVPSCQ